MSFAASLNMTFKIALPRSFSDLSCSPEKPTHITGQTGCLKMDALRLGLVGFRENPKKQPYKPRSKKPSPTRYNTAVFPIEKLKRL